MILKDLKSDSVIKVINSSLIDSLFSSLNINKYDENDPLKMFGRDSIWLKNNAENLWDEYLTEKNLKEPKIIDSMAVSTISSYTSSKKGINTLVGNRTYGYSKPLFSISMIKENDTLIISSSNIYYPYLLPWKINGSSIYNSDISEIISEIIPKKKESNYLWLTDKYFNYGLVDRIYDYQLNNKVESMRFGIKHPKKVKKLEKYFKIESSEFSFMASIEWPFLGMGAPCLELELIDTTISNQIIFSSVIGNVLFLRSLNPIIRKRNKLVKRLENNPVYQYALNNKNARGEIHFVNRKSLSAEAKRMFLQDVKSSGGKKSKYRGKFNKATFFVLYEKTKFGRNYSRWVFLKDGTCILWQYGGDSVMNIPKEVLPKSGEYACKEIDPKILK